ncbi:MAG TPA: MBL fold metallo-hydrolase, partial [Terriglobia bacterium]|nr:MBL fold metallo-hydrolase [Terriglobia bacterium]
MTAKFKIALASALGLLLYLSGQTGSGAQSQKSPKTQIVLLGTGTPLPDPERAGPSTAIIVNGT